MALHVTGVYKGVERQKGQKKIFEEIMGEAFKFYENDKFRNLRNSQTSSTRNLKKTKLRHMYVWGCICICEWIYKHENLNAVCAMLCLVAQSCPTLWPHGLYPSRPFYPWWFSRQECWSGLPCPPPGDLPDPEIEPVSFMSPALSGKFFTTSTTWEAHYVTNTW